VAYVAFCLASAGLQLMDDIVDAGCDRLDPARCGRPIAAGTVSPRIAMIGAVALVVAAEMLGLWLGWRFALVLTVYVGVANAYAYWFRYYPVVDILAVAACFVLRALGGGAASGIQATGWLLLLVSLGALTVVSGRRYATLHATLSAEVGRASAGAEAPARAPRNPRLLLYLSLGSAAATFLAYVLWAFVSSARSLGPLIPLSAIPFAVVLGRYVHLAAHKRNHSPERPFFKDGVLKFSALAWLVLYLAAVYLFS
jgi:decaprenyl-phosphate phosphoribosyltransferase